LAQNSVQISTVGSKMNEREQHACFSSIYRIAELLGSGIFEPADGQHVLHESAFIDLMINLKDLLSQADRCGERVSFTSDVVTNKFVPDITDAITAMRNACCHIDSGNRQFARRAGTSAFNVQYGKGNGIKAGSVELSSDY